MRFTHRNEGQIGLLYAKDMATGEYVSAKEAVMGKQYSCPECNCRIHVSTSKLGNRYFARYSGEEHNSDKCRIYEARKTKHTFEMLDPDKFIECLCRASIPVGGHEGTGSRGGVKPPPPNDDEMKIASFSSLKQIANEMDFLDDSIVQGNHKVSDFLLMYKYAKKHIISSNHVLGARIILCQYLRANPDTNSLIFRLYTKPSKDRPVDFSVGFCLDFTDKGDFWEYWRLFVEETVSDTGKTGYRIKDAQQQVLIASDNWEYLDKDSCGRRCGEHHKCFSTCHGMYKTVFTNKNQFFYIGGKQKD